MAKKENKVSISKMDEAIKAACDDQSAKVTFSGITIEVKNRIGIEDALAFVRDVVDSSFLEDGTYVPEMTDFAERIALLTYFTNVTIPQGIEKQYEMAYALPILYLITPKIDEDQYFDLGRAIERKIEMRCDTDVMAVRKNIETLFNALESIEKKIETIFSDVSASDVAAIADAMKGSTVSEEKIVNAYLKEIKPKRAAKKK